MVWPSPARHCSYTIHCAHSKIFRTIQATCCNVYVLHCASVHCHVSIDIPAWQTLSPKAVRRVHLKKGETETRLTCYYCTFLLLQIVLAAESTKQRFQDTSTEGYPAWNMIWLLSRLNREILGHSNWVSTSIKDWLLSHCNMTGKGDLNYQRTIHTALHTQSHYCVMYENQISTVRMLWAQHMIVKYCNPARLYFHVHPHIIEPLQSRSGSPHSWSTCH